MRSKWAGLGAEEGIPSAPQPMSSVCQNFALISYAGWKFRPRNKILNTPPPPEIPRKHPPSPSPPLLRDPPPSWHFSIKNRTPPFLATRTPLPLPKAEKNKRHMRNVHRAWDSFKEKVLLSPSTVAATESGERASPEPTVLGASGIGPS